MNSKRRATAAQCSAAANCSAVLVLLLVGNIQSTKDSIAGRWSERMVMGEFVRSYTFTHLRAKISAVTDFTGITHTG
jgi:hypothetical protein